MNQKFGRKFPKPIFQSILHRHHRILFLLIALCAGSVIYGLDAGEARWPERSGTATEENGKLALDVSHLSEGYFMAGVPGGCSHRLKLRVEKDEQTFTYDLNGDGDYEIFPLQLGSGNYEVSLYENVGGKKYAQAGGASLYAELSREDISFFYPNQYVNYTTLSPIVEKVSSLCNGMDEKNTYDTVCEFIRSEFVYDYVRAITVSAGDLPDIDGSYEKRMGICQDLSAVTVGMLRVMGIPARMIIGYADEQYHAWTMTKIGGEDQFFDPTAAVGGINSVKDYSMERYY